MRRLTRCAQNSMICAHGDLGYWRFDTPHAVIFMESDSAIGENLRPPWEWFDSRLCG